MKLNYLLIKNRETAQLVYGIILVILIPLIIAFNTVFIIGKYNRSIDVILQRQALSIGRSISTLMKGDLPWEYFVQAKLELLMESNLEIQELNVLRPEKDDFVVIASSDKEQVGVIKKSNYYKLAWMQPKNDGLATDSIRLSQSDNNGELNKIKSEKDRFWLVAMPMRDASDEKQSLLAIKLSSKIVDDLTNYNRNISIYLLIGTLVVVIMFLLVAVRLWDYVLLYRKIKEVDQMKDDFISITSHELRTPVTGIRGHSSLILEGGFGKVNEKVKKSVSMINNAAERLSILVDDLLNVSRIEQGKMKIDLESVDISEIIANVINGLKIQTKEKTLDLQYTPHKKRLPLINIDPARLKQILINLVGNAIKYTEEGSVEVITEEQNNGKILEIKIKDTGFGMSAKDKERLFDKFYRIRNEKTRKITGTGLGLWITKQLVELMDGKIVVDSIENVGTQITLGFPVIKE